MSPADAKQQAPALRILKPASAAAALGLAVSHLMTKPAFANLRFGDWSRTLVGQINRKHYCFVVDGNNQVQGFLGWALASKANAEAWVEGRAAVSVEDGSQGDCIIFNTWASSSTEAMRLLMIEARKAATGRQTAYFKRRYPDGTTRPARLTVNEFVDRHIAHGG